jgi:tRNA A58 N-methylase Trm61
MAVSAADVARVRAAMPAHSDDLIALRSIPAVCAYVAQKAREEGADEAEHVEAVVRAAEVSRADLRKARRVLARLGYVAIATRLGELASKAKRT